MITATTKATRPTQPVTEAPSDGALAIGQNERIRRGLNLALGELYRLEQIAVVVAVDVSGAKPVLTLERPVSVAQGHYVTRKAGDRRTTVWVAEHNGCQLECESDQPLPAIVGRPR